MTKPFSALQVELRDLAPIRVIHHLLLFPVHPVNPDRLIRPAFKGLRALVSDCGLDPDTLLHVGVPEVIDGELVSYDCCIEFPLPDGVSLRTLQGGRYAILTVEKTPAKIKPAIRSFRGDILPEQGWIVDDSRPVYEIYFKDTLEYCLPIY